MKGHVLIARLGSRRRTRVSLKLLLPNQINSESRPKLGKPEAWHLKLGD